MGKQLQLTSPDGHEFDVYEVEPDGVATGTIVIIQEIFGVNAHIREVAEGYAKAGYRALAPALFDRVERHVSLGYSGAVMMAGVELARGKLKREDAVVDLQTTLSAGDDRGASVGVVGYCFGGLMAYLTACELDGLSAAVSYYGGGVSGEMHRSPKVPVMFHFASEDAHISLDDVDVVKNALPNAPVQIYAADHGFNCNHRASYDEAAAVDALAKTLEFFQQHVD